LTVDIRIFRDLNETDSKFRQITVSGQGAAYDITPFNEKTYSYTKTAIAHTTIKFGADSFMIICSGLSNDSFTFSKLYLTGGTQGVSNGS